MPDKYGAWIMEHVDGDGYGQCAEVTLSMQAAFPELQRVRGHYMCLVWGERAHWWLVTPDGQIVDPTAAQFPSKWSGAYLPWVEGSEEPTGRCPNCGGPCYGGGVCCSEQCHREFAAYCCRMVFHV
jgi:hypothetical protein